MTYSLADQDFDQTKSLGIFNLSMQLLENLAQRIQFGRLEVLSNSNLKGKLRLPQGINIQCHNEAIGRYGRAFWDQWGVYEAAKNSGNQWLFLPKGFSSFLRQPAFKLAVYAHDTIHDFYRINYPGIMPWPRIKYFTLCLRETLKHSDVIFTNSDFTKNELSRLAHGIKLRLPMIITAGIGFARSRDITPAKHDSLLLLTSAWPHKLTERAINFTERWQRQAGFSGEVKLVGSLPVGMHLPHLAGWRHYPRLPETVYRQFLAEARALLFFSAYEGFGMPPVEAMIAGACPVFSDLTVTREVMADRGFSFSNDSYESFAQSMDKALGVSEAQVQFWAKQLLERHNWDRVTERIVNGLAQASR